MTTPDEEVQPTAPGRTRSRRQAPPPPPPSNSNALALGIVALVAALLALVIAVLGITGILGRSGSAGSAAGCQRLAWAALPRQNDLPASWSVQGPQFDPGRAGATLVGPTLEDGSSSAAFVQVTCYGSDASEALKRARTASLEAGSEVDAYDKGDEGFTYNDSISSSFGAYIRDGDLVVFLQLAIGAPDGDLEIAAGAVEAALTRASGSGGLDIATPIIPTPGPVDSSIPDPGASEDPLASDAAASPVAPALEALLPKSLNGTDLEISSYNGDELFGAADSTPGRAIVAALAKQGKKPADFLMAQAADSTATLEALESLWAFQVTGLQVSAYETAILNSLLNANTEGVKMTQVTLGGKSVKVIDYGDEGSKAYIYVNTAEQVLFVVSTTDVALATTVFTGLK